MAQIVVDGHRFDAKAVVFDKDGTLLDFHHIWGRRTLAWVDVMVTGAREDEALQETAWEALHNSLLLAIGFDPETGRVIPEGPSAVTTSEVIGTLATGALYQAGLSWQKAESLARQTAAKTVLAPLAPGEIVPRGDVAGTVTRLANAGLQIAIVTSDDRAITEAMIADLGIDPYLTVILCGDDPLPQKPDAGALEWVAVQLDVRPAEMVMVGDTATDMLAGRNAGVSGCIGVRDGAGEPRELARLADALVDTIDELRVA